MGSYEIYRKSLLDHVEKFKSNKLYGKKLFNILHSYIMNKSDERLRGQLESYGFEKIVDAVDNYNGECSKEELLSNMVYKFLKLLDDVEMSNANHFNRYIDMIITREIDNLETRCHKREQFEHPESCDIIHRIVDNSPSVDYVVGNKELVDKILESLPERQRLIVEHTYGLNGCEILTQVEIARKIGCSREYVGYLLIESYKKFRFLGEKFSLEQQCNIGELGEDEPIDSEL